MKIVSSIPTELEGAINIIAEDYNNTDVKYNDYIYPEVFS